MIIIIIIIIVVFSYLGGSGLPLTLLWIIHGSELLNKSLKKQSH